MGNETQEVEMAIQLSLYRTSLQLKMHSLPTEFMIHWMRGLQLLQKKGQTRSRGPKWSWRRTKTNTPRQTATKSVPERTTMSKTPCQTARCHTPCQTARCPTPCQTARCHVL